MAKIVIVGGGICGLGGALLLGRDGHDVTVLERDDAPPPASPGEAWDGWDRKGIAQFRQPHNFMPGFRRVLEAELPDVEEALIQARAARIDFLNPLPPHFAGAGPRPVDETLWTWTARRPAGEWVFQAAVEQEPNVAIRRGASVKGLTTGASLRAGTPHVTGVRLNTGEELAADLVVDATGRSSRAGDWLAAIGAPPIYESSADCNFTYYTRYFQGALPQRFGPMLSDFETISILTLAGDGDSWSVTVFCSSQDSALRGLRDAERWSRVVRAHPMVAHWLDAEPLSDVMWISGIVDRYRRFHADGAPLVTGFVPLADAWACTNPSAGRGMSIGMQHAQLLRDVIRTAGEDGWALASQFHARTEQELTPWYDAQVAADRARFAQIEATCAGRAPPPPPDELTRDLQAFRAAMIMDPDLFRNALEYIGALAPVQAIMARPGVRERVYQAAAEFARAPPPRFPGPDRRQLVELASAA